MPDPIGYVVIEYDPTSDTPDLPLAASIYVTREDADFDLDYARTGDAKAGLKSRYVLAKVVPVESGSARV